MDPASLKVTHGFAVVNQIRYHYVEAGEGPLLLLLHGFPENWWTWRYQIQPLVDAGFRVVAPDQRGYNETDKTGPYDLDTLAEDVCGLMRALGCEKAHVVGHDVGGTVAWHLAATRPAFVDRLVVLNSPHPARSADALLPSREQLMRSWYMLAFPLPGLPEMALRQTGPSLLAMLYEKSAKDRAHFSEAEIQPFADGLQKPGAVKAMIGWYRATFKQAIRRRGEVPYYPPIEAETMLIWSSSEFALSFENLVPGTEQHVPKLQVATVRGGGHFVHAEKPERVNDTITSFLAGGQEGAYMAEMEFIPQAGKTSYDVVLASAGENKIAVIREVREITGLSLKEARELVEAAPKTLKSGATLMEAAKIRTQLSEAGAVVELT